MIGRLRFPVRYVLPAAMAAAICACDGHEMSHVDQVGIVASSAGALPIAAPQISEEFVGVVVGRYSADLTPRFDGKVRDIHVRIGDRVQKGDLLATLELPAVQSELRMAEVGLRVVDIERDKAAVELHAAEDQFARRTALGREALASSEDIESARYRQQVAAMRLEATRAASAEKRTRIDQLRKDAATAELRAPFDGMISLRYVDPGATISASTRLVRLISGDDLIVRFAVPETSVHRLGLGIPIEAIIGEQKMRLSGTIEKVAPEVDAASRMIVVEAALGREKSMNTVIAGLMAHVVISTR